MNKTAEQFKKGDLIVTVNKLVSEPYLKMQNGKKGSLKNY